MANEKVTRPAKINRLSYGTVSIAAPKKDPKEEDARYEDARVYVTLQDQSTTPIVFEPKFSKGREEVLDYISSIESERQIARELSTDGKDTAGFFHVRLTTLQDMMNSPKLKDFIQSIPELAAFSDETKVADSRENRINFARLMIAQPALEREVAAMYTHRLDEMFARKEPSTKVKGKTNLPVDTQKLSKQQRDALYCFAYNAGADHPNLRQSTYHYQNLPEGHPAKQEMWDKGVGFMTITSPKGGNAKRYIGCQTLATEGIYKPMGAIRDENERSSAKMIEKVENNAAAAETMLENFKAFTTFSQTERTTEMLEEPSLPEYQPVMQEPEFPPEATYP